MRHRFSWCVRCFALFGSMLLAVAVSGQIMLSPVAVVGTDLGTSSPETPLVNLVNQSGVTTPFISGTTDFDTYFAVPHQAFATNSGLYNWQSEVVFTLSLQGYVDFDLGASRRVRSLAVWNVTAKEVSVSFAEDAAGLATAPAAGSFQLNNHWSYPFSYPVDVLAFGTPQQGRYLRLAINSTYPLGQGFNFAYAILGEVVASVAPPAVPTLTITHEPDGDVTVTFSGTLQVASALNGTFANVAGDPQTTYTLSKENLSRQQYFRAQGQ